MYYLLAVCLAFAALASSCGGEAESIGGNTAKTALLRLSISGTNAAKTRATAAALPENEATVHRLTIGLFYADGSVNTIAEPAIEADGTTGTLAVEGILCSPGTCDVIVVANAPEGTFAGVQTKNEFVGKMSVWCRLCATDSRHPTSCPCPASASIRWCWKPGSRFPCPSICPVWWRVSPLRASAAHSA